MGFYPTAPSRRMAWHEDGTVCLYVTDNSPGSEISDVNMESLNDEGGSNLRIISENAFGFIINIFPELREFDGYFIAKHSGGDGGFGPLTTSGDTTNGIDGSWTQRSANILDPSVVRPNYRTDITSFAVANVRGVRSYKNSNTGGDDDFMQSIHIYGEISPGETPDRLLFIDELTSLEFTLPKDYEEAPRGSSEDFDWRLKNNSTVAGNNKTINTIQWTAKTGFLLSAAWYTFSVGGDAFAATKSLTSLAPEASSVVLTTRRIIPQDEVTSLHAARIEATVGSLS